MSPLTETLAMDQTLSEELLHDQWENKLDRDFGCDSRRLGKILKGKTDYPGGWFAYFQDPNGNRLGFTTLAKRN